MRVATSRPLWLIAAALLAGCDRGSGTAGIDGTGSPAIVAQNKIAYGSVSALGSVWVNGVHYETSGATITIDGRRGTEADIELGDIVLVSARFDSRTARFVADSVTVDDAVEGPITTVDATASSLVVLGQTVRITPTTSFDETIPEASLASLAPGDTIEVAGFRGSNGDVFATRLERKPASGELETTGAVTGLDSARRFTIGALVVDYSVAPGVPIDIRDGDIVEVKGAALLPGGELVATTVERRTVVSGSAGTSVDVNGFITSLDAQTRQSFKVAGVPTRVTDATVVGTNLDLDAKVGVKGSLDGAGTVVASNVAPIVIGGPQLSGGPFSVMGQVFDSTSGNMLSGAPVNFWVQQERFGYSYWWANGGLYTNDRGEFTAVNLPGSYVYIHAGHRGYVQPCAAILQVPQTSSARIEVMQGSAFDTANPPRPQFVTGTTITGTVFETVSGIRQPIAGALVWAYSLLETDVASTRTDLQGRFFLCNLPGVIWLDVSADGFKYQYQTAPPFEPLGAAPVEIELYRK